MNVYASVEIRFDVSGISKELRGAVKSGVEEVLDETQMKLVKKLSTKGTGRKHPGLPNRSSRPGRPPAPQSGMLRDSFNWKTQVRTRRGVISGSLRQKPAMNKGVSVKKYAVWLERGTTRIKKRPFLAPVVASMNRRIGPRSRAENIIGKHLRNKTMATARAIVRGTP